MKLAEGLRVRADYAKKLDTIKHQIPNNCKTRENEKPNDDPIALAKQVERLNEKIIELVTLITLANANITLTYPSYRDNRKNPDNPVLSTRTMSEALIEREVLKKELQLYRNMVQCADTSSRKYELISSKYDSIEYKLVPTFDVKKIQNRCDALSKFLRILDSRIQEKNWNVDIDFEDEE